MIAYARNGHSDKFGIPRQSREESPIETRIVFEPEFAIPEALRGIEGFSHLWLIWGFSENNSKQHLISTKPASNKDLPPIGFSPTVRPPRLGGNTRMGVFATRSPFRPNPIGLSSVRLLRVEKNTLVVSGADLLDGTPIYDIKPYLSFSDSHADAQNGYADAHIDDRLHVEMPAGETKLTEQEKRDIAYILSQDPRPGYQDDPDRAYKLDYAGYTVTFTVDGKTAYVQIIETSK